MKWLGTILIIAGCGYAGIAAGIAYKREEAALEQLCEHLQYMICRLKFHQISLPELFSYLEKEAKPPLRAFYANVIRELNMRTFPDGFAGCIYRIAHQFLPQQNSKITGTRIKGDLL